MYFVFAFRGVRGRKRNPPRGGLFNGSFVETLSNIRFDLNIVSLQRFVYSGLCFENSTLKGNH